MVQFAMLNAPVRRESATPERLPSFGRALADPGILARQAPLYPDFLRCRFRPG
jgi:hypothetical protein